MTTLFISPALCPFSDGMHHHWEKNGNRLWHQGRHDITFGCAEEAAIASFLKEWEMQVLRIRSKPSCRRDRQQGKDGCLLGDRPGNDKKGNLLKYPFEQVAFAMSATAER
jgi:hypothetical protein